MRLLFISFATVPFGSNDLLYYRCARSALRKGHTVMVSPYDWGKDNAREYEEIRREGAFVRLRPREVWASNLVLRQVQKMRTKCEDPRKRFKFVEGFRPDVVLLCDPGTYYMLSRPGVREYFLESEFPFITISQYNTENEPISPLLFDGARAFFQKAQSCVFVSNRNLEVARRQLCLPLENAVVLDNPPDLELWDCLPWPESPTPTFAMVARLDSAIKGQPIILDLLSKPPWTDRSWRLSLCGEGQDERYLRELVLFLRLENRVEFRGHVQGIQNVWRENMLLLMASSGEGKPLALTEAMLCGRPAVVTDVGGNIELIEEGLTGFVAEGPTTKGLRGAMERAWSAREKWAKMGQRAHRVVKERLTSRPEERLLSIIETVAQKAGAGTSAMR